MQIGLVCIAGISLVSKIQTSFTSSRPIWLPSKLFLWLVEALVMLLVRHDITDGEINRDYYRVYEAEPMFLEYTVYIPKDVISLQ